MVIDLLNIKTNTLIVQKYSKTANICLFFGILRQKIPQNPFKNARIARNNFAFFI